MYIFVYIYICKLIFALAAYFYRYRAFDTIDWMALVSRIDKIIGLFCKKALQKRQYSAKETYNLIDPTYRSHPISICMYVCTHVFAFIFVYTYTHVCMYMHIQLYVRMNIYIYIYMYTYIYTYVREHSLHLLIDIAYLTE